jgi:hypothetical protein
MILNVYLSNFLFNFKIIEILTDCFRRNNWLAKYYSNLKTLYDAEQEQAASKNETPRTIRMYLVPPNEIQSDPTNPIHRGRTNLPTSLNELAAVYDSEAQLEENLHVIVHQMHAAGHRMHQFKYYHPECDPACHPILFPRGELGKF